MAANAKHPARLGGNGYLAMAVVEDTLSRLRMVDKLADDLDRANAAANYRLVALLNRQIRTEVATMVRTLGDAARGVYGNV